MNNMRLGMVGLLTLLCASAFGQTTKPAAFVQLLNAGKPQKIVFYGTSLTHYGPWVKQFADALDKAYPGLVTTHNGAQAGQQSRWGLANVKERVIDQQPDVVFMEFTTNDAVERFHMPVEEAQKNTEGIIDAILAARPQCQIILQIMNPVVGYPPGNNSHRLDLPAYQQMYRDLGKARGLMVIDHMPAWQAVLDKGEDEFKKYVPDGLHPGGPGCAQFVTPTILAQLGVPGSAAAK